MCTLHVDKTSEVAGKCQWNTAVNSATALNNQHPQAGAKFFAANFCHWLEMHRKKNLNNAFNILAYTTILSTICNHLNAGL